MAELRSTGYRNARAAAIQSIFDYGVIHLYSGSRPASADLAETGTLLAIITNDGGAFTQRVQDGAGLRFDGPVNGALSIKAGQNWKTNAILASGTIGYGVLYDNDRVLGAEPSSVRTYFTVGMSGADMNLSRTSVTAGEPFTLTGATITVQ